MKRRNVAVLAVVTGLVASPLLSSVMVGARPVAKSTVAVVTDEAFTDTAEEAAHVVDDLEAAGHTVDEIDPLNADTLATALEGADVLAMPEYDPSGPEEEEAAPADYAADLDEASLDLIRDFVDAGGRVLVFGEATPEDDLNDIFGFDVEQVNSFCRSDEAEAGSAAVGDPCVLTEEAAETEFADGPATLDYANGSMGLDPATLPTGATIAYLGQYDEELNDASAAAVADLAAVVSMPFGDGAVVFLGYDWYPGESASEPDWATILDLAVSQPEVSASSPAPGTLDLTMDSPSTQPVFVRLVINGTEHTVVIAAKTTSASFDVGGAATVEWDVPGWGVGEGSVEVAGAAAAPRAEPAPVAPTFTG
jgi:hypothetical protein